MILFFYSLDLHIGSFRCSSDTPGSLPTSGGNVDEHDGIDSIHRHRRSVVLEMTRMMDVRRCYSMVTTHFLTLCTVCN
jgi:hypothetical protein